MRAVGDVAQMDGVRVLPLMPNSMHVGDVENERVGLHDLYEFDLVAADTGAVLLSDQWISIQRHLLHLQPAKSVTLVGEPPTAIHVVAYGGTEVAPQLLADIERLAGARLRVQLPDA